MNTLLLATGIVNNAQEVIEPSTPMEQGVFQGQVAVIYAESGDRSFRESELAYNNTLLLYGVLPHIELRLGIDVTSSGTRANGLLIEDRLQGTTPLLLGAKTRLIAQKKGLPEVGIMGHVYIPLTASTDLKPLYTGYDMVLLTTHEINEKNFVLTNLGAVTGGDSRDIITFYTAAYNYFVSDNFSINPEFYGEFIPAERPLHFADLGFSYYFNDTNQLDINIGTGLNNEQNFLTSLRYTFTIH